jgi:hypothetical protein
MNLKNHLVQEEKILETGYFNMKHILPLNEWLQINEAYFAEGSAYSAYREKGLNIMTILVDKYGFSPILAAAICGNIFAESKFDPTSVSSTGHTGLVQWGDNRLANLKKLANWKSVDTQLSFIDSELRKNYFTVNKPVKPKIDVLTASTASEEEKSAAVLKAADIITLNYEGAAPSAIRRNSAKELYDLYMSLQIKPTEPEEKEEPVISLATKPARPIDISNS